MSQFRHSVMAIRTILFCLLVIVFIFLIVKIYSTSANNASAKNQSNSLSSSCDSQDDADEKTNQALLNNQSIDAPEYPITNYTTKSFDPKFVLSEHAVLYDVENNTILAQKSDDARIYPASLTKMMTLLVAVEHIKNLNDTFTMTYNILAPLVRADASRAGFAEGETVRLVDLLYGSILPSGADGTVGLAVAISGSEEEFVKLMNEKAKELGLKDTHFANTSGLHNVNHYSTVTDLAVIMNAVLKNDLCNKIISADNYTTTPTPQHPEGIKLYSDMFRRMYGTEVKDVVISGGKTGYTDQAGNCLASYAIKNGKKYIAVTTNAIGKYRPVFDSFDIYSKYLP